MNLSNHKGLTLTELIVSIVMISIVMLGVAAFSVAIKQIQESTNKSTVLAMQMAGAMSHVTKNATLAIGYIGDPGIYTGDANAGVANPYVCFRQDLSSTPWNYDDDTWVMYVVDAAPNNNLLSCSIPNAAQFINSQDSADTAADACLNTAAFFQYVVLQNVINMVPPPVDHQTKFTLAINPAPDVLDFYIEITLSTQYNPSNPTIHPLDNPVMTFTTRISPPGHSWN